MTLHRADVVVVGGGLAGIAATLELLDRGKSVVLVDRASEARFGGLAKLSFGGVFVCGSPEQRRSGIRDTPELALADWLAYGELGEDDVWSRRWAEAFVHRSRDDVRGWLVAHGIRFLPVVNWVERGLYVPGNSVPRFHIVWGTGEGLIRKLVAALRGHSRAAKLELLFGHRVMELERAAGRFVGCSGVVEPTGEPFRAEGDAVVLAAGGIAGDLERVRRHWPWPNPPAELLNGSHPEADGAIHDLVAQAGGRVTHLEKLWSYAAGVRHWRPTHRDHGLSLVPPRSALWVDFEGRRFERPPLVTSFDTRHLVETIARSRRPQSWQILNRRIALKELAISGSEHNRAIRDESRLGVVAGILFGNRALVDEVLSSCPDVVTAQSIPELVEKMNALDGRDDVRLELVEPAIRAWDAMVRRGPRFANDDQLRRIAHVRRYRVDRLRTCRKAPIDDPSARPLIAIRERIVTRKSLGGIETDLSSRVLGSDGAPLPGLWAVGEVAGFGGGGMHGLRALEGTFLGGCILTGRVAGRAIAEGE